MAVTISELIGRREEILNKKNETYDIETSIGTLTVKQPSMALAVEIAQMENSMSDKYLIFKTCIDPNLGDKELQDAYQVMNPPDIVENLFKVGEIRKISNAIMDTAGFGKNITPKLHEKVKN